MSTLNYIAFDGAKETMAVGIEHESQLPTAPAGSTWYAIDDDIADWTVALVNGVVETVSRWTAAQQIARAQEVRWADAKAYRDQVMAAGCVTPSGRVDTNADSQARISSFATSAMVAQSTGAAFSIAFTLQDNSTATLDAAEMLAVLSAMTSFLNACQAAGTAIRVQIDGAVSITALDAIDITSGYPAG